MELLLFHEALHHCLVLMMEFLVLLHGFCAQLRKFSQIYFYVIAVDVFNHLEIEMAWGLAWDIWVRYKGMYIEFVYVVLGFSLISKRRNSDLNQPLPFRKQSQILRP